MGQINENAAEAWTKTNDKYMNFPTTNQNKYTGR
jgi:hypothetical protein